MFLKHLSTVLTQSIDNNTYDWARRANKTKNGKILFKTKTTGTVLEIIFKDGNCISLKRSINAHAGTQTDMTISPEIIINGFTFDNNWRD
jgi:hypothetical protein